MRNGHWGESESPAERPAEGDPWNLIRIMPAKGPVLAMPNDPPPEAAPPPPAVELSGARLDHDGVRLFDSLSLRLPAGTWNCLLGPSGVGKTTLLRLIAGIEDTASGTVRCDDGGGVSGRVAYMAQEDLLLPWLTLAENAVLGRRLRGEWRRADDALARSLLGRVGLGDHADSLPAACSGGMRQRAAVVRTLVEDRPIVLMDEPFSALDAITRLRLQDVAAEFLADRTVFLVTHDPLEALRLGHRVHVMTGRPAALGPPIAPPGGTPRPAGDPEILALHAELLERLAAAGEETP